MDMLWLYIYAVSGGGGDVNVQMRKFGYWLCVRVMVRVITSASSYSLVELVWYAKGRPIAT